MSKEYEDALVRMKAMKINHQDLTDDQILAFVNYNDTPYGKSFVSRILLIASIPIICVSIYNLIFGSKLVSAIFLVLFLVLTALVFLSQYLYFKNRVLSDIQRRKNSLVSIDNNQNEG